MSVMLTVAAVNSATHVKSAGPAIWMGFMLIVCAVWAVWLTRDIRHPKSQERANISLLWVCIIGVFSMVVVLWSGV